MEILKLLFYAVIKININDLGLTFLCIIHQLVHYKKKIVETK